MHGGFGGNYASSLPSMNGGLFSNYRNDRTFAIEEEIKESHLPIN